MTPEERKQTTDRATALAAALDGGLLLASEVSACKAEHDKRRTDGAKEGVVIPVYVDKGKTK